MSDAKICQLLLQGKKFELFKLVENDHTDRSNAIKAMVFADFYASPLEAKQILPDIKKIEKDVFALYAYIYTKMALGEAEAVPDAIKRLQQIKQRPLFLGQSLLIEYFGRSRDFLKQAELVKLALLQEKNNLDWIYFSILRSLDQANIETEPLHQVIKKEKRKSPLKQLVLWRLDKNPNQSEKLKQLEELAEKNHLISAIQVQLAAMYYNIGFAKKSLLILDRVAQLNAMDAGQLGRWLSLTMTFAEAQQQAEQRLHFAFTKIPKTISQQGQIASYLLVYYWLQGRIKDAYQIVSTYHHFNKIEISENFRPAQVFFNYILNLCVHWQENQAIYHEIDNKIAVIGESHSQSPHNTVFYLENKKYQAKSHFVMGCKMFHLGQSNPNIYQEAVRSHLLNIDEQQVILFTIGEIDCRPEGGIWTAAQKQQKNIIEIITQTVENYISFLKKETSRHSKIIIQGIPAPGYELEEKYDPGDKPAFLSMIRCVNEHLKAGALAHGWRFLDVYAATADQNGQGNGLWHLDGWHLKPSFYQQADRWLIKP